MWDEDLQTVDFIPEPSDSRILSAADINTRGHQEGWRSEVIGWNPQPVPVISRPRRTGQKIANFSIFVIITLLIWGIWKAEILVIDIPPPKSEWAFENSGARELQELGFTGDGVKVCMVDTGIDTTHPDLQSIDLVFKDFVRGAAEPIERGSLAHGTMMAGILVADGYLEGVAPGVTLGMAAALGDDGDGGNSGEQNTVASAIDWCWKTFDADIISLSLGGESDPDADRNGPTTNAVRQAISNGVFVISAAGNDGGSDDDGRVSTPSNVVEAISVGAFDDTGEIWEGSSLGEPLDADGTNREHPHMKPEISAPGVGIISTAYGGEYYSSTGTSDATVFVAGILALILEAEPHIMNDTDVDCITEVKLALKESAIPINPDVEHDPRSGYGAVSGTGWLDEIRNSGACL